MAYVSTCVFQCSNLLVKIYENIKMLEKYLGKFIKLRKNLKQFRKLVT